MSPDDLAQQLLAAVRAQQLGSTPDRRLGGAPIGEFPSLDLAVVGFVPGRTPLWANVLFSREHPQGFVAQPGLRGERPGNLRYVADITDAQTVSVAWQPRADWSRLSFPRLAGDDAAPRFVAPYPASLLKVMVAVGVGLAMDAGLCRVEDIEAAARAMIVESDNDTTSQLVKRLHEWGLIVRSAEGVETHNALHALFESRGLHTLRLARTTPQGGWGNAAGSGVGHIQMTAWDTLRLLWLLDPQAPAAPWPGAAPLMSSNSRDHILRWMGEHSPNRILFRDEVGSGVHFFHKTGTTENYGSDAGIVRARPPGQRHYIVALLSNLGSRYGPPDAEFDVTPRLSGLGLAVDAIMRHALEPG
ncbi:MAG: serine hydrolase [Rubrivivax sp.]|nr:serine hydrolase [Rubrivivax sp.]